MNMAELKSALTAPSPSLSLSLSLSSSKCASMRWQHWVERLTAAHQSIGLAVAPRSACSRW